MSFRWAAYDLSRSGGRRWLRLRVRNRKFLVYFYAFFTMTLIRAEFSLVRYFRFLVTHCVNAALFSIQESQYRILAVGLREGEFLIRGLPRIYRNVRNGLVVFTCVLHLYRFRWHFPGRVRGGILTLRFRVKFLYVELYKGIVNVRLALEFLYAGLVMVVVYIWLRYN